MKEHLKLVGYDGLKEFIKKTVLSGKTSNAYLFVGDEGSGKMTLAKLFAQTIQCDTIEEKLAAGGASASDIEPCDKCRPCIQAISDNNPDIVIIERAEGKKTISVDDIREKLVNDVSVKPYACRYKIYIVAGAEYMTPEAQNAILKTLEEPPEYAVIMLLASSEEILLPTVRSRCEIIHIPAVPDDLVSEYLTERFGGAEGVTPEDIRFAVAFADGKIGRGIKVFEDPDFKRLKKDVLETVLNINDITLNEIMVYVRRADYYSDQGTDNFFDIMLLWYRDLLFFESTRDVNGLIFKSYLSDISRQAQSLSYEGIDRITEAINKAKSRLHANVSFELVMELLLLTINESMRG